MIPDKNEMVILDVQFVNEMNGTRGSKHYHYYCTKEFANAIIELKNEIKDNIYLPTRRDPVTGEVLKSVGMVIFLDVLHSSNKAIKQIIEEIYVREQVHRQNCVTLRYRKISQQTSQPIIKKENTMTTKITSQFSSMFKNMSSNFFCEVPNIQLNSQFKMGIKNANGEIVIMNRNPTDGEFFLTTASFEFMEMEVPAFAISTPVAGAGLGDIIVKDGKAVGWIVELDTVKQRYRYMTTTGTISNWTTPILNTTFNNKNIMVVKSMFAMDGGVGMNMQSMMPIMMMQTMKEGGQSDDLLKTMMMMQMMGGGGNMMGGMFGGMQQQSMMQVQEAQVATKPRTSRIKKAVAPTTEE